MASMIHTSPATGSIAIFDFKEGFKLDGGTVTTSGDGLALYSAVGDVIVTGASGAGGGGNTRAWFVVRFPDGEEWCFQRGTNSKDYGVTISRADGFVGGAPNATTRPTATDEVPLCGGGTAAAPTYKTILVTDGTYYFEAWYDLAATGQFWWGTVITGSLVFDSTMMRDHTTPTEPSDADPFVRTLLTGAVNADSWGRYNGGLNLSSYMLAYTPTAGVPTEVAHVPVASSNWNGYTSASQWPNNVSSLSISGKDPLLRARYLRETQIPGGPYFIKGSSGMLYLQGPFRANTDTSEVVTPRDRIFLGTMSLPWDGTVPRT